ncbi:MAG: hypothetical protein HUU60_12445 [Armatimonadetes bacterium]|nr:hypothetical protein [Armatimonadota bacterium]
MKPNNWVPVSLEPDPVIEYYKKDVDMSLLRENLKLTPEERIVRMLEIREFMLEVRRAGEEHRRENG